VTWTAKAEDLAEALKETGQACAVLNAAAWAARVDPDATSGLVGAAVALGAPLHMLYPSGPVLCDDRQMVTRADDLEADVAESLKSARALRKDTDEALEAAYAAAAAAAAAEASAKNEDDASTAAASRAAAEAEIADCEAALEIITEAIDRLRHALACLQRVPDDLEITYEAPYLHIRRGGKLPHSGDFLTGAMR
jgi:pyruvate/2-oxoglutarate dehydrogenase complex dihydrolipoamide acyltransferase (E2) component